MKHRLLLAAISLAAASCAAQTPAPKPAVHPNHMQAHGNGPGGFPTPTFLVHQLGTDHAEGISLLDMNGDGFVDILSGAYWYENPGPNGGEWKQHQFREVGTHAEFVSDCGEWIVDVDHDGLPDLVTTGWIQNGVWWFKNPGPEANKAGAMWKGEKIADSYDTEGGAFADINGDGKPDLALAHYGRSGMIWIDFSQAQPIVHHVGGHDEDGHGVGIADINGDGKADILTPTGWFEQVDADHDKWIFHQDWELGDAGFPILGYDVNHDGHMDIIYGQGHSYGLYWLEQTAAHNWTRHIIDESFSQSHALALADIDGTGTPELITGKRYRGHNGNDPGSYDPIVVYAYKLPTAAQLAAAKGGDPLFARTTLSINGTASAGTQFVFADFDHDGDLDIASAGKLGVHVFENLKVDNVPPAAREPMQLIFHDNKVWPFPGEGKEVPQDNEPKK